MVAAGRIHVSFRDLSSVLIRGRRTADLNHRCSGKSTWRHAMRSPSLKTWAALALAFTVISRWSSAVSAADYTSSVIATGLNNPRGLSFGPDGALYIAEAGINTGSGPTTVTRGVLFTYTE